MKILYITRTYLTDSDFPLIREYQKLGLNVDVYILGGRKSAGLIETSGKKIKYGVWHISKFPEVYRLYSDYFNDINSIYYVSLIRGAKGFLFRYLIMLFLYIKLKLGRYDLIHFTWPLLDTQERLLYKLPLRKILTVHDPIPHSMQESQEESRRYAFNNCNKFILLSDNLISSFVEKYSINQDDVFTNRMGEFDYLHHIPVTERPLEGKYILFYGTIAPHKGLEYLLEAMTIIHESIPELKLIIAGRGELYFNFKPYENLDYIVTRFDYIGIQETVNLFKGAEFLVCPYKDATQSGVVQTALSIGTPVVGTNVGALPESIIDGITGKIIPPCNSLLLADTIKKMLLDPCLLVIMRNNIDRIWRPKMGWKEIANKYITIYKKILSNEK